MPLLSCFTPCGLLTLSSKPSPAELFYRSAMAALGDQFSTEQGTHVEASVYARSMGLGRATVLLEHAGDQGDPARILELIPTREAEYGIVPGPNDTITDRRRALSAARKLPLGGSLLALTNAFDAALGDAFLAVRPTPSLEAVSEPPYLGDQPMNLQTPETADRKFISILETIITPPETTSMQYEPLDPNLSAFHEGSRLRVGDVLVIDSENSTRTERVTVTAVGTGEVHFTFTATFTKTHTAPFSGTTIPFPLWASSKRHFVIVLSVAGAADAETRRKADELAAKLVAGVATWNVAGGESVGGAISGGPFKVGEGLLGITPIGTCAA